MTLKDKCQRCEGTGYIKQDSMGTGGYQLYICKHCNGVGFIPSTKGETKAEVFDWFVDEWECHGCGKFTKVKAIILPNLCSQQLYLCQECEAKLSRTFLSQSLSALREQERVK